MHAWLFRNLPELRQIYGVGDLRQAKRTVSAGRGPLPAPGTLRRSRDGVALMPARARCRRTGADRA